MLLALFVSLFTSAAPVQYDAVIEGEMSIESLSPPLDAIQKAAKAGKKEINVKINSPGGSAFAMLEFMVEVDDAKHRGMKVVCWADGILASAAFITFQGVCDVRNVTSRTLVLGHGSATSGITGKQTAVEDDLNLMKALDNMIAVVVCPRMGLTKAEWDAKTLGRDWWMIGADMVTLHAADKIVLPADMPTKLDPPEEKAAE